MYEKSQHMGVSCPLSDGRGGDMAIAFRLRHTSLRNEYRQFVKNTFIRNVSFFSKMQPFTIEEFASDFFRLWKEEKLAKDVIGRAVQLGGAISFAYIDGNHSYEFVKADFCNVDKYLEVGGFILFDDSADYHVQFGVNRLMKEIKKKGNYKVVIKNPNYLVKKTKQ